VSFQLIFLYSAYLALYGSSFSLNFVIPGDVFLQTLTSIPFDFQVKQAQLYAYLPASNMTRNNLLNLANHQKKWNQPDGKILYKFIYL